VLAGGGGDDPQRAQTSAPRTPSKATTTSETTSTPAAPTPAPANAPTGAATTPQAAVRGLYERAAAGDFDGAWSLAGPGARAQFGGSLARFRGTLGTLRSITFTRLAVRDATPTTATVDVATVARHTDRTDRCRGSIRAVRDGDRWLVDSVGVRCG
jgi:hypothetical protein